MAYCDTSTLALQDKTLIFMGTDDKSEVFFHKLHRVDVSIFQAVSSTQQIKKQRAFMTLSFFNFVNVTLISSGLKCENTHNTK